MPGHQFFSSLFLVYGWVSARASLWNWGSRTRRLFSTGKLFWYDFCIWQKKKLSLFLSHLFEAAGDWLWLMQCVQILLGAFILKGGEDGTEEISRGHGSAVGVLSATGVLTSCSSLGKASSPVLSNIQSETATPALACPQLHSLPLLGHGKCYGLFLIFGSKQPSSWSLCSFPLLLLQQARNSCSRVLDINCTDIQLKAKIIFWEECKEILYRNFICHDEGDGKTTIVQEQILFFFPTQST